MRATRIEQCPYESGLVHKYWRCHNGQMLLASDEIKRLYMYYTRKALKHKSVGGQVGVRSFCCMSNHVHMLCEYHNGVDNLSKFMRIAHTGFGLELNKMLGRRGKVAVERPFTPFVEKDSEYEWRSQFYVEANPLKAGIVNNLEELKNYKYNSFAYYAYGVDVNFSSIIVEPDWYRFLGRTPKKRQQKYREMFLEYLDD